MADYYRQFHLYFVKGPEGSELENADSLMQKYRTMSWRRQPWAKLVLLFYINYTVGQEARTPKMQKLRRLLHARYGNNIPVEFRERFRKASLPLMKYTNILSFNTRSLALFVSILIFRMPWLYFAFELTVLNILMVYMVVKHENICHAFIKELENQKP